VLAVNFIILMTMSFESPLHWTRTDVGTVDFFDRSTGSYAKCSGENSEIYAGVLIAFNMILLIVGNWYNFMSRYVELEFGESRFVGISLGAMLQAWVMGIPVLFLAWEDPRGRFFAASGVVGVTSLAIQLCIFVPKIIALYQLQRESKVDNFVITSLRHSRRNTIKNESESHEIDGCTELQLSLPPILDLSESSDAPSHIGAFGNRKALSRYDVDRIAESDVSHSSVDFIEEKPRITDDDVDASVLCENPIYDDAHVEPDEDRDTEAADHLEGTRSKSDLTKLISSHHVAFQNEVDAIEGTNSVSFMLYQSISLHFFQAISLHVDHFREKKTEDGINESGSIGKICC
jgi:hypothetical protein